MTCSALGLEPSSRSPQGECGLKFRHKRVGRTRVDGRSPQGECGLKLHVLDRRAERFGRSPQGECGLKFPFEGEVCHAWRVAPRKGSVD